MKLIFLNTWHGELHDELRAYITKHKDSTDVFCFQEAPDGDRSAYDDLLVDFSVFTTHRPGTGFGNATYVRKTISVVDSSLLFGDAPSEFDVGIGLQTTLLVNGVELTVCNIHGYPQPGHKLDSPARLYQTEAIIKAMTGKEKVIIGGDFNLLPAAQSVRLFAESGYQDLIEDFGITTTRNKITFEAYPENIQYYADYVFTSPSVSVESFAIPDEIVSDHQPLELEVTVND